MTRPAVQAVAWVAALLERTAVVGAGERRCGANLVWVGQAERGPPRGRDEVRVGRGFLGMGEAGEGDPKRVQTALSGLAKEGPRMEGLRNSI